MQEVMEWLEQLGGTRRTGVPPLSSISVSQGQGTTTALLTCPAPTGGPSAAVANLLLQEFVAGSKPSRLGLSRGLSVEVLQGPDSSISGAGREAAVAATLPPQPLVLRFTAAGTDAATEQRVRAVAEAFEPFLQFHIKAAKSTLHTRMRKRLAGMRQALQLTRHPAPAQPLC